VAIEKTKAIPDAILMAKYRTIPTISAIPPLLRVRVSRSIIAEIRNG
jgi:hypothetical protein